MIDKTLSSCLQFPPQIYTYQQFHYYNNFISSMKGCNICYKETISSLNQYYIHRLLITATYWQLNNNNL